MVRIVPTSVYLLVFIALIIGNIVVYRDIFAPPTLKVSVLAAGKSNAVLVQSPSGRRVLINTGSDASIVRSLGSALPMWERSLDAVIITSSVTNAVGGLTDVLKRYRTPLVIRTTTEGSRSIENLIADATQKTSIITVEQGRRFNIGGATLEVLWPPVSPLPLDIKSGPLVLLISYGSTSFLIKPPLSPLAEHDLAAILVLLPSPDATISSSTRSGTYYSNGSTVVETK